MIHCKDQSRIDFYWSAVCVQGDGQCGSAKDKFCLSWQIVPEELPMLLKGPRARYVLAAIMPVKSSLLKFFARLCAMSIIRLELEPTLFSAINWTGATSIACGYPFVGFIVATKILAAWTCSSALT